MRIHPFAALLACVAAAAVSAPPASAAPDSSPAAMLRGAHFSPDTPSVDVYLTSFKGGTQTLALSGVKYGDVSDYSRLDAGQYTVGMRPAGADPSTPVVFSYTLDAKPGQAFTALAIGMNKTLEGRVLADDLSAAPAGQTRVRVIQAANNAKQVDITAANGPVFGMAVPFTTTTGYSAVQSGAFTVTARSSDNAGVATTADVSLTPGRAASLVLLDSPQGGLSLRSFDDAVGVNIPPTGPVEAGTGPAPTTWLRSGAIGMTALALLVTIGLVAASVRRSGQRA